RRLDVEKAHRRGADDDEPPLEPVFADGARQHVARRYVALWIVTRRPDPDAAALVGRNRDARAVRAADDDRLHAVLAGAYDHGPAARRDADQLDRHRRIDRLGHAIDRGHAADHAVEFGIVRDEAGAAGGPLQLGYVGEQPGRADEIRPRIAAAGGDR